LLLNFVQLGEAKSLVVALCMASVCADASMAYFCRQAESQCSDRNLRRRSFSLAVLYEFFRETSCDVRDIAEDAKEGLHTLPVRLGKRKTMLLMTVVGLLLDSILTQSVTFTASGVVVRSPQLAYAILRVGLTMAAYRQILKYPRDNYWAWGSMSLFGLVPVLFAQAALHS
jgi:4-hydroxybenzoate polyprenyltransferase